nr:MAG TPA: hypothetical protein [Caudoviricetes sp.]
MPANSTLNRAGTISPSASSSVTFSDSILIPGKSRPSRHCFLER